jgi:hypothetical protein
MKTNRQSSTYAGGLRGAALSFKGGFGADVLEGTPCAREGYFVIRKGSTGTRLDSLLRLSSNAFLINLQGNPKVGAYEIRITVATPSTNYERGSN